MHVSTKQADNRGSGTSPTQEQYLAAVWLLPSLDQTKWLEDRTKAIGPAFGISGFTPHLTIRSGTLKQLAIPKAVSEVATVLEELSLPIRAISSDDAFFRAVYLDLFSSSDLLATASKTVQPLLGLTGDYVFKPQLKFAGGESSSAQKAGFIDSLKLPFHEIHFNRVQITMVPNHHAGWRAVNEWISLPAVSLGR